DSKFKYRPTHINIVNNGHTIQVNYDPGSSIELDGVTYNLIQFHFHKPSEHTLGGKKYPMELHLVHKSAEGKLAVVGMFIDQDEADNATLAPVWQNMPTDEGEAKPEG